MITTSKAIATDYSLNIYQLQPIINIANQLILPGMYIASYIYTLYIPCNILVTVHNAKIHLPSVGSCSESLSESVNIIIDTTAATITDDNIMHATTVKINSPTRKFDGMYNYDYEKILDSKCIASDEYF